MKALILLSIILIGALPSVAQTRESIFAKSERATVKYELIAPGCDAGANLASQISSGCLQPSIKVAAHPSSPNAVAFFVLVLYKSIATGSPFAQAQFTMERDSSGDFIATFVSGDMSEISISAIEVEPGGLVAAREDPAQ